MALQAVLMLTFSGRLRGLPLFKWLDNWLHSPAPLCTQLGRRVRGYMACPAGALFKSFDRVAPVPVVGIVTPFLVHCEVCPPPLSGAWPEPSCRLFAVLWCALGHSTQFDKTILLSRISNHVNLLGSESPPPIGAVLPVWPRCEW